MPKNPLSWYRFEPSLLAKEREELRALGEDTLADTVMDHNGYEVESAAALIEVGAVEPNVFCSSDWLAEIQERFRSPEDTPTILALMAEATPWLGYSELPTIEPLPESNFSQCCPFEVLQGLEREWTALRGETAKRERESDNEIPNFKNLTTVHAYLDSVIGYGRYPTPEILLAIAKAFELYLIAGGALTLEQVFFGPAVQRAGNFAKRSRREQRFLFFHDTVRRERGLFEVTGKPFSLEALATVFLRQEREMAGKGHTDPETFLRGYRDWKTKHPDLADE
ncbi:hypothetical protein Q6D67_11385 [Haliea sp. E1-2-M8]|uniref:hypothetical protein n=1 Tax=Haliea sp. E1-2-M8 TaxID=3064706 RepID=UPI0027283F6C|nr:hypothetical protein [Haliea sp. E1-2-M8]MDO8862305.1 hypothetical protein [Haliea sp. E1-2-M8]